MSLPLRAHARTGPVERLPLDETSPWWGEHRSRYLQAVELAADRVVLDIACGTGYGSVMLAEGGARFVVGCDAEVDALHAAIRAREGPPLSYMAGDGAALPFVDATFDLVVSFETIEHVVDGRAFLRELRRVLKRGGMLILSTPNADVTRNYPANPFHVREYTANELTLLLRERFEDVTLLGQRPRDRYAIAPFLPGHDAAQGGAQQFHLMLWKALRRLPGGVGNAIARVLLGRNLYPSETDYLFDASTSRAHVLLARCRA